MLDRTIRKLIAEHESADAQSSDLLSNLLSHTEIDPDGTVQQLALEEIRNELMTMLLAGHDTTAAALVWTLFHLAANPNCQERAREEIRQIVGCGPIEFEQTARLEFLERAIKESLRLHPPAIGVFLRQAMEDVQIGEWPLHKGDLAGAYSWVVHRDPRWFPQPDSFDPDRFLPEREERLPAAAYFPFGFGPRMCIGLAMANLEVLVVIATFLQRFRFSLPAGMKSPRPLAQMSLRPEGGMSLTITPVTAAKGALSGARALESVR